MNIYVDILQAYENIKFKSSTETLATQARGVGNLTFACVGWGKLNRKCQVSNNCFFRAPKPLTAKKHMFGRDGRI